MGDGPAAAALATSPLAASSLPAAALAAPALLVPVLAAPALVGLVLKCRSHRGGVHHDSPRQKWHASYLLSQYEHNGVICPSAHSSLGHRSRARQ